MDWLLAAATGRDALPGQHLADFVPLIPLIPNLEHPISTSEATALPLKQVEPQGTTFAVADPMERAGHAPLVPPIRRGTPLLRLDAVGWALRSVASIISTSGSGASDADNSEKIRSRTPLSHQWRQRL